MSAGSTYTDEFRAVAETVPRARTAVTGFALAAGADGEQLDAIRLAASEAVTNAVVHAYGSKDGSVRVSASYVPGELWLLVEDDGAGLRAGGPGGELGAGLRAGGPGGELGAGLRAGGHRRGLGVGLVLIAQLADSFEILRRSNGGTQLQMRFKLRVGSAAAQDGPRPGKGETLSPA